MSRRPIYTAEAHVTGGRAEGHGRPSAAIQVRFEPKRSTSVARSSPPDSSMLRVGSRSDVSIWQWLRGTP
jgi:hypothetical protein